MDTDFTRKVRAVISHGLIPERVSRNAAGKISGGLAETTF
jgi:hypothetical protein